VGNVMCTMKNKGIIAFVAEWRLRMVLFHGREMAPCWSPMHDLVFLGLSRTGQKFGSNNELPRFAEKRGTVSSKNSPRARMDNLSRFHKVASRSKQNVH
jgi:hypothetical protein